MGFFMQFFIKSPQIVHKLSIENDTFLFYTKTDERPQGGDIYGNIRRIGLNTS